MEGIKGMLALLITSTTDVVLATPHWSASLYRKYCTDRQSSPVLADRSHSKVLCKALSGHTKGTKYIVRADLT